MLLLSPQDTKTTYSPTASHMGSNSQYFPNTNARKGDEKQEEIKEIRGMEGFF